MSETFACSDMCVDQTHIPIQSYDDAKKAYYERLRSNFEIYEVGEIFSTKLNLTEQPSPDVVIDDSFSSDSSDSDDMVM